MKKPPEGNRSPSEASLSNPWGGVLSWPSQEGCGYAESLLVD
jgi:hypothetical protein